MIDFYIGDLSGKLNFSGVSYCVCIPYTEYTGTRGYYDRAKYQTLLLQSLPENEGMNCQKHLATPRLDSVGIAVLFSAFGSFGRLRLQYLMIRMQFGNKVNNFLVFLLKPLEQSHFLFLFFLPFLTTNFK